METLCHMCYKKRL